MSLLAVVPKRIPTWTVTKGPGEVVLTRASGQPSLTRLPDQYYPGQLVHAPLGIFPSTYYPFPLLGID